MSTPCFSQRAFKKATQHMEQCWFPPQSPATSTAAWQRVIKKKGSKRKSSSFTQLQQQQKWRKYAAQPKVTAPSVFEYEVDASPSSETIQIYENIHKCIRINFYLSAITLSLSSKFFTPFDVSRFWLAQVIYTVTSRRDAISVPPTRIWHSKIRKREIILEFVEQNSGR